MRASTRSGLARVRPLAIKHVLPQKDTKNAPLDLPNDDYYNEKGENEFWENLEKDNKNIVSYDSNSIVETIGTMGKLQDSSGKIRTLIEKIDDIDQETLLSLVEMYDIESQSNTLDTSVIFSDAKTQVADYVHELHGLSESQVSLVEKLKYWLVTLEEKTNDLSQTSIDNIPDFEIIIEGLAKLIKEFYERFERASSVHHDMIQFMCTQINNCKRNLEYKDDEIKSLKNYIEEMITKTKEKVRNKSKGDKKEIDNRVPMEQLEKQIKISTELKSQVDDLKKQLQQAQLVKIAMEVGGTKSLDESKSNMELKAEMSANKLESEIFISLLKEKEESLNTEIENLKKLLMDKDKDNEGLNKVIKEKDLQIELLNETLKRRLAEFSDIQGKERVNVHESAEKNPSEDLYILQMKHNEELRKIHQLYKDQLNEQSKIMAEKYERKKEELIDMINSGNERDLLTALKEDWNHRVEQLEMENKDLKNNSAADLANRLALLTKQYESRIKILNEQHETEMINAKQDLQYQIKQMEIVMEEKINTEIARSNKMKEESISDMNKKLELMTANLESKIVENNKLKEVVEELCKKYNEETVTVDDEKSVLPSSSDTPNLAANSDPKLDDEIFQQKYAKKLRIMREEMDNQSSWALEKQKAYYEKKLNSLISEHQQEIRNKLLGFQETILEISKSESDVTKDISEETTNINTTKFKLESGVILEYMNTFSDMIGSLNETAENMQHIVQEEAVIPLEEANERTQALTDQIIALRHQQSDDIYDSETIKKISLQLEIYKEIANEKFGNIDDVYKAIENKLEEKLHKNHEFLSQLTELISPESELYNKNQNAEESKSPFYTCVIFESNDLVVERIEKSKNRADNKPKENIKAQNSVNGHSNTTQSPETFSGGRSSNCDTDMNGEIALMKVPNKAANYNHDFEDSEAIHDSKNAYSVSSYVIYDTESSSAYKFTSCVGDSSNMNYDAENLSNSSTMNRGTTSNKYHDPRHKETVNHKDSTAKNNNYMIDTDKGSSKHTGSDRESSPKIESLTCSLDETETGVSDKFNISSQLRSKSESLGTGISKKEVPVNVITGDSCSHSNEQMIPDHTSNLTLNEREAKDRNAQRPLNSSASTDQNMFSLNGDSKINIEVPCDFLVERYEDILEKITDKYEKHQQIDIEEICRLKKDISSHRTLTISLIENHNDDGSKILKIQSAKLSSLPFSTSGGYMISSVNELSVEKDSGLTDSDASTLNENNRHSTINPDGSLLAESIKQSSNLNTLSDPQTSVKHSSTDKTFNTTVDLKIPGVNKDDPFDAAICLVNYANNQLKQHNLTLGEIVNEINKEVSTYNAYILASGDINESHISFVEKIRLETSNFDNLDPTTINISNALSHLIKYIYKTRRLHRDILSEIDNIKNHSCDERLRTEQKMITTISQVAEILGNDSVSLLNLLERLEDSLQIVMKLKIGLEDSKVREMNSLMKRITNEKSNIRESGFQIDQSAIDRLVAQVQLFIASVSRYSEGRSSAYNVRVELKRIKKQRDQLLHDISNKQKHNDNLEAEVLTLKQRIEEIKELKRSEINFLKAENASLRLAAGNQESKNDVVSLKRRLSDITAILDTTNAEKGFLQVRCMDMEDSLIEAQEVTRRLQSQLTTLTEESIKSMEKNYTMIFSDLDKIKDDAERAVFTEFTELHQKQIEETQAFNQILVRKVSELESIVSKLKSDLAKADIEIEELSFRSTVQSSTIPKAVYKSTQKNTSEQMAFSTTPNIHRTDRLAIVESDTNLLANENSGTIQQTSSTLSGDIQASSIETYDTLQEQENNKYESCQETESKCVSTGHSSNGKLLPKGARFSGSYEHFNLEIDPVSFTNDLGISINKQRTNIESDDAVPEYVHNPLIPPKQQKKCNDIIQSTTEKKKATKLQTQPKITHYSSQRITRGFDTDSSHDDNVHCKRHSTGVTSATKSKCNVRETEVFKPNVFNQSFTRTSNIRSSLAPSCGSGSLSQDNLSQRVQKNANAGSVESETSDNIYSELEQGDPRVLRPSRNTLSQDKRGNIRKSTTSILKPVLRPLIQSKTDLKELEVVAIKIKETRSDNQIQDALKHITRLRLRIHKLTDENDNKDKMIIQLRQRISEITLQLHRSKLDVIKSRVIQKRTQINSDNIKSRLEVCYKEISSRNDEILGLRKELILLKNATLPITEANSKMRFAQNEKERLKKEHQLRKEVREVTRNALQNASSPETTKYLRTLLDNTENGLARIEAKRKMWVELERKQLIAVLSGMSLLSNSYSYIPRSILPEYSPFKSSRVNILKILYNRPSNRVNDETFENKDDKNELRSPAYSDKLLVLEKIKPPLTDEEKKSVVLRRETPELEQRLAKFIRKNKKSRRIDNAVISQSQYM